MGVKEWIELGGSCGVFAVLFFGGRWVGRIEVAAEKISRMAADVAQIPLLRQEIAQVKEAHEAHRSEFKRLAAKVDETRDVAIRAELQSQHDID